MNIFDGVHAYIGQHAGEIDVLHRSQLEYGDGFSLQIMDGTNAVGTEELKAADVETGKYDDRIPCLYPGNEGSYEEVVDVGLARSQGLLYPRGSLFFDVLDIGESLGLEQFFGYILWGLTDAWDLH
jgi:hypothetical protein